MRCRTNRCRTNFLEELDRGINQLSMAFLLASLFVPMIRA